MLINKFLDCYYKKIREQELNKAVSVPVSMAIENSLDSEGWPEWKIPSSEINDELIKKIESLNSKRKLVFLLLHLLTGFYNNL